MSETPAPARFLALGDSYTIGEGAAPAERWPMQLAARLRADGVAVADPEIVAVTGWTVAELDAGLDAADPQGPFDVVTLLIGVNDQYRGHELDGYRAAYRAMLARAVGLAGDDAGRVVAVSVPDWGVTPFAQGDRRTPAEIAAEVNAVNAAARAEAEAAGAAWVDVTALSRTQGAWVVGDGLHPSGEAYHAWADRIEPAVRAALAR
ncbi:SGNH/GDSL hydrolase family protein [Rubrivirga sp.]|uniref:SGNH/GDSL hydrolase family protein n=1 Tax=Rubrivirga sp. TaxID=1885344 RepID=UPI003B516D6F